MLKNEDKELIEKVAMHLLSHYEKYSSDELVILLKSFKDIKALIPFDKPVTKSEIAVLAHDKMAYLALSTKISADDLEKIDYFIDNQNVN